MNYFIFISEVLKIYLASGEHKPKVNTFFQKRKLQSCCGSESGDHGDHYTEAVVSCNAVSCLLLRQSNFSFSPFLKPCCASESFAMVINKV